MSNLIIADGAVPTVGGKALGSTTAITPSSSANSNSAKLLTHDDKVLIAQNGKGLETVSELPVGIKGIYYGIHTIVSQHTIYNVTHNLNTTNIIFGAMFMDELKMDPPTTYLTCLTADIFVPTKIMVRTSGSGATAKFINMFNAKGGWVPTYGESGMANYEVLYSSNQASKIIDANTVRFTTQSSQFQFLPGFTYHVIIVGGEENV